MAEFDRLAPGDGAAWERQFNEFMANADLSFGVLSTELWSTPGLTLGRKALRRLGRRGLLEFAGSTLVSCRDWVSSDVRVGGARTACSRRGCCTPASGPSRRRPGFMTQVIAARAPARRHARAARRRRAPRRRAGGRSSATPAARCGSEPTSSASSSRTAARPASGSPDGEIVAATRAVVANVTPTQLYGSLLGGSDVPPAVAEAAARFRYGRGGDADPPRARRAAALEGPDADAARALPDRARHARPRRRLARRQRGRARAAAGRGDDRLRPARARSTPRARRTASRSSGSSCRSCRAGRIKGDAAGEIDVGDGTWTRRRCARPTPTASSPVSATQIENLGARDAEARRRSRPPTSRRSTATSSAATSTAARARSTRTCSGGRSRQAPGPRDGGRRALAHRREHASRARPRRRLRLPRRQGADEAAARRDAAPRESSPARS